MTSTTSAPVNTARVANRRKLRFSSLADVLADVETLAAAPKIQQLGNWSAGQIFDHLARTMNYSIDGFPSQMPAILRFIMGTFMKRHLLNKGMTPGFALPNRAQYMLPPPTTLQDGLAQIRGAIARQNVVTKRVPSPFMGKMTNDDWLKLHCRHAELHLSFLVPLAR